MKEVLERGMQMRTIEVDRKELLEKLKKNREEHVRKYNEAVEGYKEDAHAAIDKEFQRAGRKMADAVHELHAKVDALTQEDIEEGPGDTLILLYQSSVKLEVPRSHEEAYDQVIAMMEMEVNDTVKVQTDEFAMYVLDKWDWKDHFEKMSMGYSKVR